MSEAVFELLTKQARIVEGLKDEKSKGNDAFESRVSSLADVLGYEAGEIVTGFERFVAMERTSAARSEFDASIKGQTLSASLIDLFNAGNALAKDYSLTAGKNVSFSLQITQDEGAETPTIRGNFRGLTATTGSNIDGWTAYKRGVRAGDAFEITRSGKGSFRDETKGSDIPTRGLIKWIFSNYPESNTAEILAKHNKAK